MALSNIEIFSLKSDQSHTNKSKNKRKRNLKWIIKKRQSRNTDNIGKKTQNENKQTKQKKKEKKTGTANEGA